MKQFLTVFKFEFKNLTSKKFYRAITIIGILAIGLALSLPPILKQMKSEEPGTSAQEQEKIIIINNSGYYKDISFLENSFTGYQFILNDSESEQTAKEKVENEEIFATIVIKDIDKITYYQKSSGITDIFYAQLEAVMSSQYTIEVLRENNLQDAEIARAITPVTLDVQYIGSDPLNSYWYNYAVTILLFMSLTIYGQLVSSSIAQEKSSRAMEILATSAKPESMIFGKVLGIGVGGIVQIIIFLLTALLFYQINVDYWAQNAFASAIFDMSGSIFIYTVLSYITGFFIYAFLFAAIGSLVSKVEEVSMMATPVMLLLVASYMLALLGTNFMSPSLIKVLSYIPFFSPMLMYSRYNIGSATHAEMIISYIITFATIILLGYLSTKIYRIGILMYGKPPKLKELAKMLKSEKSH